MRVAVISDIHGNLHALEAALAVIEDERPDAVWCLGDLVGYGPRPNECCARVAGVADVCLIGNHDLGVLEQISLEEFSHEAAASARWTQGVLDDKARGYLADLTAGAEIPEAGAELYHVPLTATVEDRQLTAAHAPGGTEFDYSGRRVLLNPGSVGQPRDGDPNGAFVLLDLAEQRASFRRVQYDVERTQKEILDEGLPEPLAERLAHGL
jgi:predicted phosphodiesterase